MTKQGPPPNREELLQRRKKLKARLERERRMALIEDLAASLKALSVSFAVHLDREAAGWLFDHFPVVFSGIDWTKVQGSTTRPYIEDNEKDRLIAGIISEHLAPNDTVTVIFGNADTPCLSLEARAVIRHTDLFTDECEDLWVVCPEKGFCLECYHEGYVGYKVGK